MSGLRIFLLFCVGTVLIVPIHSNTVPIEILSSESEISPDGTFHFSYESADGSKVEEHGSLKVFNNDEAAETVAGSYQFPGDDGETYVLKYTADETGYHPEGKHLPVAPAIPEAIAKALKFLPETTE